MPVQQLIPDPNPLRSITILMDDLTLDLTPGVRLQVSLEWADGMRATVASEVVDDAGLGDLPDHVRDVCDAFLWGEGAKAVLAWAQKRDRSAQARRVREWAASIE